MLVYVCTYVRSEVNAFVYILYSFLICSHLVNTSLVLRICKCSNPSTTYMKNLIYHFPTCYAYSVKRPIGELNLKRALDEDTRVFSSFFSFFHLLLH